MWKKSEIFKSRKFQIWILAQLCALALGLLGILGGDEVVYRQELQTEITSEAMDLAGLALSPGSYEVFLSYETTEDKLNSVGVYAADAPLYGLLTNEVYLSAKADNCRFQFYAMDWLGEADALLIKIKCNGEQKLLIKDVEVVKTTDAYLACTVSALALFLLMDWLIMLYVYMGRYEVSVIKKLTWFGLPTAALVASAPVLVDYIVASGQIPSLIQRIEILADGLASEIRLGDIPLLFPALLRILGFPMTAAYSIYIIGLNVVTTYLLYWLLKQIFRNGYIGMVGAVLYIVSPYRLDALFSQVGTDDYFGNIMFALLVALIGCVLGNWLNKHFCKNVKMVYFGALLLSSLFWSILHSSNILNQETIMLRPYTIESFVDVESQK
ncbi:MAG: hypothetical protein IJW63_07115 [Lachnospiraceae bacterium]|nr:hypothetical protein [Lachnospiraceae bacterium]